MRALDIMQRSHLLETHLRERAPVGGSLALSLTCLDVVGERFTLENFSDGSLLFIRSGSLIKDRFLILNVGIIHYILVLLKNAFSFGI